MPNVILALLILIGCFVFLLLIWQFAEKVIFLGLLKNAQMQGARNPEE